MKKYIEDIKKKTSGMSQKEACAYVCTYYWYHILGTIAIIALILLFGSHYLFGNKKPEFMCVMVNQETDTARDREMAEDFANRSGLDAKRVVIDSGYNFSYGSVKLQGVNESSYEKFFFQWRGGELDAVILPESFYLHVKEMGGAFRPLEAEDAEGFERYMDGGLCTALVLGNDEFTEKVSGKKNEKLLLAFPESGKHPEVNQAFIAYVRDIKK